MILGCQDAQKHAYNSSWLNDIFRIELFKRLAQLGSDKRRSDFDVLKRVIRGVRISFGWGGV